MLALYQNWGNGHCIRTGAMVIVSELGQWSLEAEGPVKEQIRALITTPQHYYDLHLVGD